MKKFLLFLGVVALLLINNVKSQNQFANNSFENWSNQNQVPTGWNSLSFNISTYVNLNLCDISKSNEANQGNYSVQMKPKKLDNYLSSIIRRRFPSIVDLDKLYVPAFLTNATINFSYDKIEDLQNILFGGSTDFSSLLTQENLQRIVNYLSDGLDLTSQNKIVSSISGYYKFTPSNDNDRFYILPVLVNRQNNIPLIVGGGRFSSSEATNEFTYFDIPITYISDATELILLVFNPCITLSATNVSILKLDDITVNYTIGIDEVSNTENNIIVYPNPTINNKFRIALDHPQTIFIYNDKGQQVKQILNYQPNNEIYLQEKGIYFIKTTNQTLKVTID